MTNLRTRPKRSPRSLARRLPWVLACGLFLVTPGVYALCTTSCTDVNNCGNPDAGCTYLGCTFLSALGGPVNRGCCYQYEKQIEDHKFYDCPGGGDVDCLLIECKPQYEGGCGMWGNPTCPQ